MDTIVKLANMRGPDGHRMNIWLHGPAGSGKSTGAKICADVLGLPFYYFSLNPQTPESRVLGYNDATGKYITTAFRQAFEHGGVCCIDEADNGHGALLNTLNAILENGIGSFPDNSAVPRHKDFVCVVTANTIGRGGDINYPERRAVGTAFIDRFVFVNWGYDWAMVRSIVGGIIGDKTDDFMTWVREQADKVQTKSPAHVVSPRAYIQGAVMLANSMTKKQILASVIERGI